MLSFRFFVSISSPSRLDNCPVVPSYVCLLPSRSAPTQITTAFRLLVPIENVSVNSIFVIIKLYLHFISLDLFRLSSHRERECQFSIRHYQIVFTFYQSRPTPAPSTIASSVIVLITFTARGTLSIDLHSYRSYTAPIVDFPLAQVPSNDND